MRAAIHFGLAVALVLAPALCCCTVRMAHAKAGASACCSKVEAPTEPVSHSCCSHKSPAPPEPKRDAPQPKPGACACCAERAPGAPTEGAPRVAAAEPTGELLPLAVYIPAGVEHTPARERCAGSSADAKSEALFARHVLRC
jgi:hypothetical protein